MGPRRWDPVDAAEGEPAEDTFLRLACLTYTDDDPDRRERAAAMLRADPGLAIRTAHTAAACGNVVIADPDEPGGPYGWPPLMYLAYSRLDPVGDPVDAARELLDRGADPRFAVLWRGEPTPFTVLTGVLGEGERGPVAQPRHPRWRELAELLLSRGADAKDAQGLYNRMFGPDSAHLALLLAHGLGDDRNLVEGQLRWAVGHDMADRTRLLLPHAHRPDRPDRPGLLDELAAEAARLGHRHAAAALDEFGARPPELDPVDSLIGTILGGEAPDPAAEVLEQARRTRSWVIVWAAGSGNRAALATLLELGFPVNARGRGDVARPGTWETALHQAAHRGDADLVDLLLAHGADRTLRDERFDATPADWAEHGGHSTLASRLR